LVTNPRLTGLRSFDPFLANECDLSSERAKAACSGQIVPVRAVLPDCPANFIPDVQKAADPTQFLAIETSL
jgi:hypothetical protein